MFAKRLLHKAIPNRLHLNTIQDDRARGNLTQSELDLRVAIHYGIPRTSSILAVDSIQSLLAVATLDGRIKVFGGYNIEGLLTSPNQAPYTYLEFLQNQGILIGISNNNDIQVWNLENRVMTCSLQWNFNITAFSVICGSQLMYVGDEYGSLSVLKYSAEDEKLMQLPYSLPENIIAEAVGVSFINHHPIVGVLPQPCSSEKRILIAYENGLIILWDISKERILFVGGGKDLQRKDSAANSMGAGDTNLPHKTYENFLGEKEITAICWASSNGSIIAVGYIDGDILFWNATSVVSADSKQAPASSSNVVKLQFSSSDRKLPVIMLHWISDIRSCNDKGRLFIYGGAEIGSEEVLTVLSLEWSSGMKTLRCVGRVDLALAGTFMDMILFPTIFEKRGDYKADLFVLTNLGQLSIYDDVTLSALISQQERKSSISAVVSTIIPMVDPFMAVAKLKSIPTSGNASKLLKEIASDVNFGSSTTSQASTANWPLKGGLPGDPSTIKDNGIQRVYLAGYRDGSVRIWDVTCPVLSSICFLEAEAHGIGVTGSSVAVADLNICFLTLTLAVGDECGLIRIYKLNSSSGDTSIHFVTTTNHEVNNLAKGKGHWLRAAFSLLNSPIQALQFSDRGAKLAAGFECGHVALLDMNSLSVLFIKDPVSGSSSPVTSISWRNFANTHNLTESKGKPGKISLGNSHEELIFILTKDAKINAVDASTGNTIRHHPLSLKKNSVAISMYLIEGRFIVSEMSHGIQLEQPTKDIISKDELMPDRKSSGDTTLETQEKLQLQGSRILLCCTDSLHLFSLRSVIQGNNKSIRKVKHDKLCCWTSTIEKDDKVCGLILLFQNGSVEFRSFPDLELIKESSLSSILRWSSNDKMEKTTSCDNGLITLASKNEVAFISLLDGENIFRNSKSWPCLHDKALAVAADAAFDSLSKQKKQQVSRSSFLSGIVKGFRKRKVDYKMDITTSSKSNFTHLEDIFAGSQSSNPTLPTRDNNVVGTSSTPKNNEEPGEIDIDDIEIDDETSITATSSFSHKGKSERERLLQGAVNDAKPRRRTPEEIRATYRKAEDASSVAANARNKLIERQEKLEKISRRTEELQSGAEDFATLANELVKTMESRKWWHI